MFCKISELDEKTRQKAEEVVRASLATEAFLFPKASENEMKALAKEKIRSAAAADFSVAECEDGKVKGVCSANVKKWDTNFFGKKVAAIEMLCAGGDYFESLAEKEKLLNKFGEWRKKNEVKVATARYSDLDLSSIHSLEKNGFTFMENLVTFTIPKNPDLKPANSVRQARASDEERVAEISRNAFSYDRFHSDAHIDKKLADELYAQWARNSIKKIAAQEVFVHEKSSKIDGFITCKITEVKPLKVSEGVIELFAVDQKVKGSGAAEELLKSALAWFSSNCDVIHVGTQSKNVRAMRFYEKNGFRAVCSQTTLHAWF